MPVAKILLLLLLAWYTPTPEPYLEGKATYYRAGLMEQVAQTNGYDLSGYKGGVAPNRMADKGREVWIEVEGRLYGPFLAVDCAAQHDYQTREDKGLIIEVDYQWAMRWHMKGPIPVTVYFFNPKAYHVPT